MHALRMQVIREDLAFQQPCEIVENVPHIRVEVLRANVQVFRGVHMNK